MRPQTKTAQLNLRVDPDFLEEIKAAAAADNRSVSNFITTAAKKEADIYSRQKGGILMDVIMTQHDLDSRLIKADHLISVPHEKLRDVLCVCYASTRETFYYDATGLDIAEREGLVRALIRAVQSGCNFSRDIIAISCNIYFVY